MARYDYNTENFEMVCSVEWNVNFMMYELRGLPFHRGCITMRWLEMMIAVVIR